MKTKSTKPEQIVAGDNVAEWPNWSEIMTNGRLLLKRRHGSLSAMARELGVKQPSLTQYLTLKKEPGFSRAIELIRALQKEELRQAAATK